MYKPQQMIQLVTAKQVMKIYHVLLCRCIIIIIIITKTNISLLGTYVVPQLQSLREIEHQVSVKSKDIMHYLLIAI